MITKTANRIVSFKRITIRIDAPMAAKTFRIPAMLLGQLTDGEGLGGLIFGETGHLFWRTGQLFAQEHFAYPIAAEDRAGPRCAGLFGERGGVAENAAAAELLHPFYPPPGILLVRGRGSRQDAAGKQASLRVPGCG